MCGGAPSDPGVATYPNNGFWESYVNRLLFPQLLTDDEIKTVFGMSHQSFYQLVEKYAIPYLQRGGPGGGTLKPHHLTPDALMGLLLLKCQQNLSDRLLGAMYGEDKITVNHWLHGLRDFIYQNDEWLIRRRNLSNQA